MDNFIREVRGRALSQFEKIGLQEQTKLSKEQLFQAVDFIYRQNSGKTIVFSPKLKSKLWHQSQKQGLSLRLENFLNTLSNQLVNTQNLVLKTEKTLSLDTVTLQQKIQLRKKIIPLKNQLKYLRNTFKIPILEAQKITQPNPEEKREKSNEKSSIQSEQQRIQSQRSDIQKMVQRDEFDRLKMQKGDIFLQIFLRGKGVSSSSISRLQKDNISCLQELQNLSIQQLGIKGVKMSDSLIIKRI